MTSQNEEAEDLMRQIEKEEERVAYNVRYISYCWLIDRTRLMLMMLNVIG
jgi:hypothetical protein